MKKTFLALALLTAFNPVQAASDPLIESVTVIGGGYSQHWGAKNRDWYNEDNKAQGIMINDKYVITSFVNSFHRQSLAVAYNWELASYEYNDIRIGANILLGLVRGYKDEDLEFGYLGNDISLYTLPNITARYKITDHISVGLDIGFIVHPQGLGNTETFNFTYSF